jgi:hypothetical protein
MFSATDLMIKIVRDDDKGLVWADCGDSVQCTPCTNACSGGCSVGCTPTNTNAYIDAEELRRSEALAALKSELRLKLAADATEHETFA